MGAEIFQKVSAHIEAHLFEPLSVATLANVAGLSSYHFSRAFTAQFGQSVMSFVRSRRMEEAAARLSGERPPALAELAFDCGFESQEAFTRAFTREFGRPPGKFKRETLKANRAKQMAAQADGKLDMTLLDGLTRRGAFVVAGVAALFDDNTKAGIPALWPKLIGALPLSGQKGSESYGVCWSADKSAGIINYMAGVEVEAGGKGKLPDGFETIAIAPQSYLVFRIKLDGPNLHPQIQAAMRAIWSDYLPKSKWKLANAPDFEFYPAGFDPMRPGMHVDYYYIPVVV